MHLPSQPSQVPASCAWIRQALLALGILLTLASCASSFPAHRLPQAEAAYQRWQGRPDDPDAAADLHASSVRVVKWFAALPPEKREESCREAGLEVEHDEMPEQGLRQLLIADEVEKGLIKNWHTRPGIGVPVVAWRKNDGSGPHDRFRPPEGLACPMTAVLEPRGEGRWRLRFLSPEKHSRIRIGGREYPLAANFSAPIALIARRADELRRSGRSGMLNSTASARKEKLYLIDPYDPGRIPLLMVHGLQSTPVAFANLTNDISADPVLRQRYQIWHYHYPTGTPVLYNAAVFRKTLDRTLNELDPSGKDFATRHLVVIGHSMGGILTRTLTCDSGYVLWDAVMNRRPVKNVSPHTTPRKLTVEDIFLFRRDPRVRRVIFVAVPHRGSTLADNWIGDLGQRLFRGDDEVTNGFAPLLQDQTVQIAPFLSSLVQERKLSSIRTLSPRSPALMALSKIPPQVPFHSIIGQTRSGPATEGSDGVVTYSSSHLDGAVSELIVRSGHNAFHVPPAVAEIKRILHEHLGSR